MTSDQNTGEIQKNKWERENKTGTGTGTGTGKNKERERERKKRPFVQKLNQTINANFNQIFINANTGITIGK